MIVEKRKRGRPKGAHNKVKAKVIEQGPYKFITGKCPCVFYKYFVLGPMFCKHHYPMYLETDQREH